jgi:arylsulfatase
LLIDQGGGWALYVKDGKPIYHYNFLGLKRFSVASAKPLPAGKIDHQVRFLV